MNKLDTNALSEAVDEANKWATQRMRDIDRNIADATRRAEAVHDRTKGGPFEAFGQDRVDSVKKLAGNPPYGITKFVKGGSLLLTIGLAIYGALQEVSRDDDEKK